MTRRVIQFSTGNVGEHALRMLIERPDVELVGLHASSPAKIGRDAGELAGLDVTTGVLATDDLDALVALNADCVVYTSQAETRAQEAMAEIDPALVDNQWIFPSEETLSKASSSLRSIATARAFEKM